MLTHTIELYDQEAIWGKNNTLTTSILIDTLTVEAGVLMTFIIQSPFVCKISFYFCLTCEQALAFVFFPLMAQPPYYTFNSHL